VAVEWTGEAAGDQAGISVDDAGDIDGDGVHDVAVGAWYSSFYASSAGAAYVISGVAADAGGSLGDADLRIYGSAGQHLGGDVLGLGDINGDGNDDLGVTIMAYGSAKGALLVYFGPVTGTAFSASADATISEHGNYYLGQEPGSLGARGDMDGDGTGDLALGQVSYGGGSHEDAYRGQVSVLSGASVSGSVDLLFADATITGMVGRDVFGRSASLPGDLDGDGMGELLAGATGTDDHGSYSGTAYLFYGSLSGTYDAVDADATFVGDDAGWKTGSAVTGGQDLTGDGVLDLLIGCPYGDGDASTSGLVAVVAGVGP
jgi:hypothetical protein